MPINPQRIVILDIDGLRRDVYENALAAAEIPNLLRIVGGPDSEKSHHVPALSVAPSITFAAQASIYTGRFPREHRVVGNELFDRHASASYRPRHYGFDVGDTLAVDDAVNVFKNGLANHYLSPTTPTLYETFAAQGKRSMVAYNMYSRGAEVWITPNLVDIARFTKGKGLLGLEAGQYDARMLDDLSKTLKKSDFTPDLLTVYMMGLDHHSHLHGPDSQPEYLREVIDSQVGRLLDLLAEREMLDGTLFVILSDHGQIAVIDDERHALHLGFPFENELEHVFAALGLDVHDYPGEDPDCDALITLNGGLAHVYLQNRQRDHWSAPPRFTEDVLPVAQAFAEMSATGRYEESLRGALELIMVRNVEAEGWETEYVAYVGDGQTQPLPDYLAAHPELPYTDPVNRLRNLSGQWSGDILLAANGREGFCFGGPLKGVHGSLYRGDSEAVLTFAYPGGDAASVAALREQATDVVASRCASDHNRQPSIADMAEVLRSLWPPSD